MANWYNDEPRIIAYAWMIGGRICDLPGRYLDRIATAVTSLPARRRNPLPVQKAQRQIGCKR